MLALENFLSLRHLLEQAGAGGIFKYRVSILSDLLSDSFAEFLDEINSHLKKQKEEILSAASINLRNQILDAAKPHLDFSDELKKINETLYKSIKPAQKFHNTAFKQVKELFQIVPKDLNLFADFGKLHINTLSFLNTGTPANPIPKQLQQVEEKIDKLSLDELIEDGLKSGMPFDELCLSLDKRGFSSQNVLPIIYEKAVSLISKSEEFTRVTKKNGDLAVAHDLSNFNYSISKANVKKSKRNYHRDKIQDKISRGLFTKAVEDAVLSSTYISTVEEFLVAVNRYLKKLVRGNILKKEERGMAIFFLCGLRSNSVRLFR